MADQSFSIGEYASILKVRLFAGLNTLLLVLDSHAVQWLIILRSERVNERIRRVSTGGSLVPGSYTNQDRFCVHLGDHGPSAFK